MTILEDIVLKILMMYIFVSMSIGQQTKIAMKQGTIMGFKVFPDNSRSAVFIFLGVPYAQAPVGELRFAPPKPHNGWNSTLQAVSPKPLCPQLSDTVFDETADGRLSRPALFDEDCLYMNIWVPEVALRFGSIPVLVILTGEEMSYDWPHNRVTGMNFAAEGSLVVTVQYRSNIFGWINLGGNELSGNYGLKDQDLALRWVHENIQLFGGNPNEITLLGHGTSGAASALAHTFTFDTSKVLFSKLILMSGGDYERSLKSDTSVFRASKLFIQKLGCHFEEQRNQIVSCLRTKSVSDLLKAFESIYEHGNGTLTLGPALSINLRDFLSNQTFAKTMPPILIGIASNEGAFLQDYWIDLAREGYQAIRTYVNYTILPKALKKLAHSGAANHITEALNWHYFSEEASVSVKHLLYAMQRILSETIYETPFYKMLESFVSNNNSIGSAPIYAYIFDISNSMDMRGKVNIFGGASHSSDLPLLFGPSLFQQISRRRLTADEEKLCNQMRTAFLNFVKSGNPTPNRVYDAWLRYSKEQKFIYNLGDTTKKQSIQSVFESNIKQIEDLLEDDNLSGTLRSRTNRNEYQNPYQLANEQNIIDGRRNSKSHEYFVNQQDSGYVMHLKRVFGFWHVMLPNMVLYKSDEYGDLEDSLTEHVRLMEASADAARYKHGFFALLCLIAVLLAILALCVYLLRRDPMSMTSTRTSEFCL